MDDFIIYLTREEKIGDRIEFSIKKNISIRFVKRLLEAKLPYHPKEETIKIFYNGELQADDVMVYTLKDESSNGAYLSFEDDKKYVDWVSTTNIQEIPEELKKKLQMDVQGNQPRRFQFLIDREDGAVERELLRQGRQPFVINLSINTLIVSGMAFYFFYYSEMYDSFRKTMIEKIGFSIHPIAAWLLVTILYILIPSIVDYVHKTNPNKKKKDMVDYAFNGILGDIWLCIYYFFATMLPFNWGPRVFRD